jgi:hypothetical protein
MRTLAYALSLAVAASGLSGIANAGTLKSKDAMVSIGATSGASNPALTGPFSAAFSNTLSKGSTAGDSKCTLQVQLSKMTGLTDSDPLMVTPGVNDTRVICIIDQQTSTGGTNLGQGSAVLRGIVKAGGVKIKVALAANGIPCSGLATAVVDGRTACYEPDPLYNPTLTLPFSLDPTQGVVVFSYAPRPASALIATQGLFFP